MKKIIVTLSAVALAVSGLSGCANMNETQRDTGMGAAIGSGSTAPRGTPVTPVMSYQSINARTDVASSKSS